jgi:hypothetical protein
MNNKTPNLPPGWLEIFGLNPKRELTEAEKLAESFMEVARKHKPTNQK